MTKHIFLKKQMFSFLPKHWTHNSCLRKQLPPLTIQIARPVERGESQEQIPGVTGQNIPPAGIYPVLKRHRLDYTRVYYGLGQFIPRSVLWPRPNHTSSGQNIPSRY